MSTQRKHENLAGPGFWMNETSGVLAPVVVKYMREEESLTHAEILTMRAYLWQWIMSPVWDPSGDPRGELSGLRRAVVGIRTEGDIDAWLDRACDLGIDPL